MAGTIALAILVGTLLFGVLLWEVNRKHDDEE